MTTLRDVFQGAASQETNYVQYSIFLPSKSDDKEIIRSLQDHLAKIHSIVQPIVNDYIWQKDRFALSIAREQSNGKVASRISEFFFLVLPIIV